MTDHITSYPLCWPQGKPRQPDWKRERAPFHKKTRNYKSTQISIAQATSFTLKELERMGIPDFNVIISSELKLRNDGLPYSNQRNPDDVGVSVWWKDGKRQLCIAIDKYDRIADNLYAIGKTIEAMRGIERWGGGETMEQAFTGFMALPDKTNGDWRAVLGIHHDCQSIDIVARKYRVMRGQYHPDNSETGDHDMFIKIQEAYKLACEELQQ